jgi:energy-coupling factor transporter ATP-binding protein EcfA2
VTLRAIAQSGTAILVAEARAGWLERLADTVLVLHEGVPQRHGPADAVLRDEVLPSLGIRPIGNNDKAATSDAVPSLAADGQRLSSPNGRPVAVSPGHAVAERPSGEKSEALVAVEQVSFRYPTGVAALKDVSLSITGGERIALLGRNGAGKSTLLRQLNGLLRPTTGRVLVRGDDTARTTVARCARTVALSFQDVRNQLFARSVGQELLFGPRNLGYSAARCDELVAAALDATELTPFAEEHPYDLLPQQRRLVAIAAALAMDTPLLVLDEPGAGMDDAGLALLARIVEGRVAQGASVLVVSHDVAFAADVTTRLLLMAGGELCIDNPWSDLDAREQALLEQEVGLPHGQAGQGVKGAGLGAL